MTRMRGRKRQWGSSLVTIMVMLMLLAAGVFALLAVSQHSSLVAARSGAIQVAKDMGDSAITLAISQVKQGNIEFRGEKRYDISEETFGVLSFDSNEDEPYSTNNLTGTSVVMGWNQTPVPPRFCHLVGVGNHRGLVVVREAFVKDPPFPYSLASAGQIVGESLEVFSVESLEVASAGPVPEDQKEPGHILSNFSGSPPDAGAGAGDLAIALTGETSVTGNVKAVGSIEVGPTVVVNGNVLPGVAGENLPQVRATDYDPQGKPYTYNWDNSYPDVSGRARHEGNLVQGDLKLSDGLLYVDGDLIITGTISGHGALVATGNITITGSMQTTADMAALVAGGDITVVGNGADSSRFQGLVYAENDIRMRRTTVVGAAISGGTESTVEMIELRAIHAPDLTSMEVVNHATLQEAMESGRAQQEGDGNPIGILIGTNFTELTPSNSQELQALAEMIAHDEGIEWSFVVQTGPGIHEELNSSHSGFILSAFTKWQAYVQEHRQNQVETIDVFALDLNQFLSLNERLEMMLHRTARR